jgi:hypothetical protein
VIHANLFKELAALSPEEAAERVRGFVRRDIDDESIDDDCRQKSSPIADPQTNEDADPVNLECVRPKRLNRADEDAYWRTFYHPRPEILSADARGTTYRVNKNAVGRHIDAHHELVDLFQFFFDIKPLLDKHRMSTTEYVNVLNQLEETSSLRREIDRDFLKLFSSRHFASLSPSKTRKDEIDWSNPVKDVDWMTIRRKANWARSETAKMRKRLPHLKDASTAKQVDWIAECYVRALNAKSRESRREALERTKKTILIDTRSSRGLPKHLRQLPVDPPQGSFASLHEISPGSWVMWIQINPTSDNLAEQPTG